MRTIKDQVALEATTGEQVWATVFGAVMTEVARCFPRRGSRLLARQMTQAVPMELERRSCWTLAEVLGYSGPHRLQHFLSHGSWHHDAARDRLARWSSDQLAQGQAVLAIYETWAEG